MPHYLPVIGEGCETEGLLRSKKSKVNGNHFTFLSDATAS